MNKVVAIGLTAASWLLTACQSDRFQVSGVATGFNDGDTICLTTDLEQLTPMTTVTVNEQHFEIEEMADTVRLYAIYPAGQPECRATFFGEPGTIKVEMSSRPGTSRVSGTKLNDEWQSLNDLASDYGQHIIRLVKTKTTDQQLFTQTSKLYQELVSQIEETAKRNNNNPLGKFIKENWNHKNL